MMYSAYKLNKQLNAPVVELLANALGKYQFVVDRFRAQIPLGAIIQPLTPIFGLKHSFNIEN